MKWRPDPEKGFLGNLMELRSLFTRFALDLLLRPIEASKEAMLFYTPQRCTAPVLKLQRNFVGVPLGALKPLLFHDDYPDSVKYAGFGFSFTNTVIR